LCVLGQGCLQARAWINWVYNQSRNQSEGITFGRARSVSSSSLPFGLITQRIA
jgi:hypothetical protein